MAPADFSRQALRHFFSKKTIRSACETFSDKNIVFPSYTQFIYADRSE